MLYAAVTQASLEAQDGLMGSFLSRLVKRALLVTYEKPERDGPTVRLKKVEILSPYFAVRLRDVSVVAQLNHGASWGFLPTFDVRVKRATVIRSNGRLKIPHERGSGSAQTSSKDEPASQPATAVPPAFSVRPPTWLFAKTRWVVDRLSLPAQPRPLRLVASLSAKGGYASFDVRLRGETATRLGQSKPPGKGAQVPRSYLIRLAGEVSNRGKTEITIEAPKLPMQLVRGLLGPNAALPIESGSADLVVDAVQEREVWLMKGAFSSDNVCIEHRRFGDGRVCQVELSLYARAALSSDELYLEKGRANLNGVDVRISGHFPRRLDLPFDATLKLPPQPVHQVLAAIPKKWRTGLFGFDIAGRFSLDLELAGTREELAVVPHFRFSGVEVRRAPAGQDPRLLNLPMTWQQSFPVPHKAELSRANPYFASLGDIPEALVEAIRLSEDASFFSHDGFDRDEIGKALTDLKDGRSVRGASTITQQLAKNLFFDGDRNLCRKIEEAIITAALESSVPKQRLLEIYLNIVEWGEGVYGIGAASHHYFNKKPAQLKSDEAAFLAGILPAPRKVDRELRTEGRSAWADKRVLRVIRFMCDLGKADAAACARSDGYVATAMAGPSPAGGAADSGLRKTPLRD